MTRPPRRERRRTPGRWSSPERDARACYDHLAGRLGVQLLEHLVMDGRLLITQAQPRITSSGEALCASLCIDIDALHERRRCFARLCLDGSERRHHLAGALGAALLERFVDDGWIVRVPGTRAVRVTTTGRSGFERVLGMVL